MKMKFLHIFIVLYLAPKTSLPAVAQTLEPFPSTSETPSSTPVLNDKKEDTDHNTSGPDQMFWVLRNSSSQSTTPEADDEAESVEKSENTTEVATEMYEAEKTEALSDPAWAEQSLMDEQIFLTRNKCDIEIQINEWEDRKLKIEYGNMGTNSSGECHTTVYGKGGLLLALLVTDVHFGGMGANHSGEMLRIVSRNRNFNYTLMEYRGNEHYYPVILADSNRVFITFYYNATGSTISKSGFNLEVFNYYKNPIRTIQNDMAYGYSGVNINDIYLTTSAP